MSDSEKITQLQKQLDTLLHQQEKFRAEIHRIKRELVILQNKLNPQKADEILDKIKEETSEEKPLVVQSKIIKEASPIVEKNPTPERKISEPILTQTPEPRSALSLEQYIGGNLINKIGMGILLLGIGLFVKYAIDKGLFPPTLRVMLGYLAGLSLVGLAYFLKKKYQAYSAVLFAGGMSVLYFTSYLANIFFDPPVLTSMISFVTMVLLTVITVVVAIRYDQQIIGILGLVGAYAVPILISTGSENYTVFFTYVAIINVGVVILAAQKKWNAMTYIGFFFTWVSFLGWLVESLFSNKENDLMIGWIFSILFFQLFYAALVLYQVRNHEKFSIPTIILILLNAIIFYVCNSLLVEDSLGSEWLSLSTLLNGLVHFGFSYFLYSKLDNKTPFLFLSSMGIILVTAAVPMEFKTHGIIFLWMAEAVGLFYIARKYKFHTYEVLSFIGVGLSLLLLLIDWSENYFGFYEAFPLFFNIHFLMGIFIGAGVGVFWFLNQKFPKEIFDSSLNYIGAGILLGLTYFGFFGEISHWFDGLINPQDQIPFHGNPIVLSKNVWLCNYTFTFLSLLGFLNIFRWKIENLNSGVIILGLVLLVLFGVAQLPVLNHFREAYLSGEISSSYFLLRYVFYGFAFLMLYVVWISFQKSQELLPLKKWFPLLFYGMVLVVLTNELSTLMLFQMGTSESTLPKRVGYSILWGVYALFLIGRGFWKNMQILRVAGMVLFAATLVKVFLVDLVGISTVSRTIIFIALGILLLIVSYLYQRYNDRLTGED